MTCRSTASGSGWVDVFATTKAGGTTFAFPNVCKVPTPAGPVPTPFPSIGQIAAADASTCSLKVTIENQPCLHVASEIPMTQGDEAGTAGGVVSGTFGGPCKRTMGSAKVMIEGNPAVRVLMSIASNGTSANAPSGMQLAPSQAKVLILA